MKHWQTGDRGSKESDDGRTNIYEYSKRHRELVGRPMSLCGCCQGEISFPDPTLDMCYLKRRFERAIIIVDIAWTKNHLLLFTATDTHLGLFHDEE